MPRLPGASLPDHLTSTDHFLQPIAKNALTILINLTGSDDEIRANVAEDDTCLTDLVRKITVRPPLPIFPKPPTPSDTPSQDPKDPNPLELSQLLANLSVHPSFSRLLTLNLPPTSTSASTTALNQLLDLFVTHPSEPSYDHISYLLASLSGTSAPVRQYFLTTQPYDNVTPLSKIFVFTDHPSLTRRRGVASVLKNVCFEIDSHPALLALTASSAAETDIDILPYLLLPLAGNETYPPEEMEQMLPDLQLLPPDKEREADPEILLTHVESLTLLTTTKEGRERLREVQVYAIVRECHSAIGQMEEKVGEAVERLVNVLMRDEEGEGQLVKANGGGVRDVEREVEEVL